MSRRATVLLWILTLAIALPLIARNERTRAAHHLPTILSTR